VAAAVDATTANAASTAARRGGMGGNLLDLIQCRTPAAADTSGSTRLTLKRRFRRTVGVAGLRVDAAPTE
jgi:hypothetical protein